MDRLRSSGLLEHRLQVELEHIGGSGFQARIRPPVAAIRARPAGGRGTARRELRHRDARPDIAGAGAGRGGPQQGQRLHPGRHSGPMNGGLGICAPRDRGPAPWDEAVDPIAGIAVHERPPGRCIRPAGRRIFCAIAPRTFDYLPHCARAASGPHQGRIRAAKRVWTPPRLQAHRSRAKGTTANVYPVSE